MKKYELTEESREVLGRKVYRIRALLSFSNVESGELGGFVESESNLSQEGSAWVCGNAWVYDNAWVYGNAKISKTHHCLVVGPIGSNDNFLTFYKTENGISVGYGGCTRDIDTYAKEIQATHGDDGHAKACQLAIELAKLRIAPEAAG